MFLGIHIATKSIYFGQSRDNGHYVDPQPVLSQISFGQNFEDVKSKLLDVSAAEDYKFVFREDSFDPVSRTRRGRIYQ